MAVAWLLTILALAGATAGISLGQSRLLSCYLAAAGGGVLFGISLFWLLPEIAATSGWLPAWAMTAAACGVLAAIDRLFIHAGEASPQTAIAPLLIATAIHSFVDGWSVRALEARHMASIAAPLGLALHKIPEGLAIGWISRRAMSSAAKAAIASAAAELVTLAGAYVEPHASQSGIAVFGVWWTQGIVAIISGSFLFVGLHAILPNRKRISVMLVFFATLLLVGTIGFFKSANI